MQLVSPSISYKDSFIEAVKEFKGSVDRTTESKYYQDLSVETLENDFASFVEEKISHARGENLPEGFVPDTELWLVDGEEYIGEVRIRHYLSEHLEKVGGHIGYDIRPSKRRLGYGSKILELALPEAKALGITRALITCNETNIGSRKIIEKNGGVFSDKVEGGEEAKLRFWIEL